MDSLQEILFSLRRNKLRTGLTAFGRNSGTFGVLAAKAAAVNPIVALQDE